MAREEIIERVLKVRAFDGVRFFPRQSSRERVAELNRLLVERGFAPGAVRMVDTTDGHGVLEEIQLGDPTFALLLKFSLGVTRLRYEVADGVIEISANH